MQAKKAKGAKLGGTTRRSIENQKAAAERAEALRPVLAGLAGMSHRKIAAELNALGARTPAGGQWHAVTVSQFGVDHFPLIASVLSVFAPQCPNSCDALVLIPRRE